MFGRKFLGTISLVAAVLAVNFPVGCTREEVFSPAEYGYVEFRIFKSSSAPVSASAQAFGASGSGSAVSAQGAEISGRASGAAGSVISPSGQAFGASDSDSASGIGGQASGLEKAVQRLDRLSDATKVRVALQYGGSTITQTLILNSFDADNAEYGLRSDPLQLLAGEYTVVGFYLYDSLDELLYTGVAGEVFTVVPGGLEVCRLAADSTERGMVTFRLVKDLHDDPTAAETTFAQSSDPDAGAYPFSSIALIDITLKNLFTQETVRLDSLGVTMKTGYGEGTHTGTDGGTYHNETMYGVCAGTFWLPAGNYRVSSYTTYSDKRRKKLLEVVPLSASDTFTVSDNELTSDVEVPIQLSGTAEYIKDYLALKAIWEKMGGEHWSYVGQEATAGVNWNFNKDIDQWGDQPGVGINSEGRVYGLSLAGFGASGNVPDEIGQLDALEVLYLGTHSESIGGSIAPSALFCAAGYGAGSSAARGASSFSTGSSAVRGASSFSTGSSAVRCTSISGSYAWAGTDGRAAFRLDYRDRVLSKDIREHLSGGLKDFISRDPSQKPIRTRKAIAPTDMQSGVMTNGITGISRALMRCKKLSVLYVANSPMTDFFVDVQDERYSVEDCSWADFTALTDIEIYNTKLTSLPVEMLANLPDLISANLSRNPQISAGTMLEGWKTLLRGNFARTIQILYLGYNNLEDTPEFLSGEYNQMTSLGLLDLTYNSLRHIYPLGKEINLVDFYLDHNELTELPVAEDGHFIGYYDVEELSCSYNRLQTIPNAFNAGSAYTIETLDFSHNEIVGVGTDAQGNDLPDFRGINVSSLDLSYNRLTEFPSQIFASGSPVTVLLLSGNGIREIRSGALEGSKSAYLQTLDMSYNELESIAASEFSSERLPYLYGLGLSCNKFSSFPLGPLYNRTMAVMEIRCQRDDEGNRCLREWPTGLYTNAGLRAFYIGGNDLRKIDDTISTNIYIFEIADNPNIQIDLSGICTYIRAGYIMLFYDKTQNIRGCDALFE